MSQQSKLASWQQLKAQKSQPAKVEEPKVLILPVVEEPNTKVEEPTNPESTIVENLESNVETVKKPKKGTVNV